LRLVVVCHAGRKHRELVVAFCMHKVLGVGRRWEFESGRTRRFAVRR